MNQAHFLFKVLNNAKVQLCQYCGPFKISQGKLIEVTLTAN